MISLPDATNFSKDIFALSQSGNMMEAAPYLKMSSCIIDKLVARVKYLEGRLETEWERVLTPNDL